MEEKGKHSVNNEDMTPFGSPYLGDLRTGRALLQAIEYQEHWVALLDWGSAALKLADRERIVGWKNWKQPSRSCGEKAHRQCIRITEHPNQRLSNNTNIENNSKTTLTKATP